MPESATESATAAPNAGSWKIVVHASFQVPEIGILVHEGPKQLKVSAIFNVKDWREELTRENRIQWHQNWNRSSCEILDPIFDGDKIEAVAAMIRQHDELEARHRAERDTLRESYKRAYGEIFPHRKEA